MTSIFIMKEENKPIKEVIKEMPIIPHTEGASE